MSAPVSGTSHDRSRPMTHAEFNALLRLRHNEQVSAPRNVRLPSEAGIRVGGDLDRATLFLSEAAVRANMQADAAAFEGWAAVLMAWCLVRRVAIDWHEPADSRDGHYQRFLYRLIRFQELMGSDVVEIVRSDRLKQCLVGNGGNPTLNLARGSQTTAIASRPGSEAELELRLADPASAERRHLVKALSLTKLDRQVPVGVFDGPPRRGGEIFTGGKSAIDLLGLGRDGALWLLELKTAKNIKVGALSEMFFYSMVLRDVGLKRICFHEGTAGARSSIIPAEIAEASRVHARLLASASHPLLSLAVFGILSDAAARNGWTVDYGFHDLTPHWPEL